MFTKKALIWAMAISLAVVVGGSLIFNNPFGKTAEAKSQAATYVPNCPVPQVWDPVMHQCTCRVCENEGSCGAYGACDCGGCQSKPGYGPGYVCSPATGIGHCVRGIQPAATD